jgi:hypothetical protein
VCAFYALCAIVVLTMWRTSSWIGIDGLIASYRQHRRGRHYAAPATQAGVTGTAPAVKTAVKTAA